MTGHDAAEWAVTMPWNGRSRCAGMGGHDRAEHALKAKNIRLLREGNYPGVPHVRAVISRIEPGFYGGIVNAPAEVDVTLQVIQDNAVSREITYQSKGLDFSLGGRVRVAAKQAGFIAAKYLETQVALR